MNTRPGLTFFIRKKNENCSAASDLIFDFFGFGSYVMLRLYTYIVTSSVESKPVKKDIIHWHFPF